MNFWPFKRRLEQKSSETGRAISAFYSGQPVWTPRSYEKLAREGYILSVFGGRCVKMIADNAASITLMLRDAKGEEIEQHPILDLLKRPNPENGGTAFLRSAVSYLLLEGNAYIEAVAPRNGIPNELWTPRPDRMKIIPGNFGVPVAYQYDANGQQKIWRVTDLHGHSPILHIKEFHPSNDWYGLGRVEQAAMSIDWHNAGAAHNTSLLQNSARPAGVLNFKPVTLANGSISNAPAEMINKAVEDLELRQGPENAGRAMVTSGNVEWTDMGISPREMDFDAGMSTAARQICTAFGVPFVLLVDGSSTYNNMAEAKLSLWEDTILPIIGMIIDELNNWLCPMFGDGLHLEIDMDDISALEPRREQKRTSTALLLSTGVIDNDEARAALDYGPWQTNTVQKVDAAVLNALIVGVPQMGTGPLVRYAKSVGLYDASMSPDEILKQIDDQMFDPAEAAPGMADVAVDLSKILPSEVELSFGSEIFTEVDENQKDKAKGLQND